MSTVLICVDNSKHSENAFDFYARNVHKPGNTVTVVHCPEKWDDIKPMEGPTPGRLHELQDEAKQNTAAIFDKYKQMMRANNMDGECEELNGKKPWEAIVLKAEKCKASLIVVGNRGVGVVRRTLLGSVSDSVVHHVHCPVLVCHLKDGQHHH